MTIDTRNGQGHLHSFFSPLVPMFHLVGRVPVVALTGVALRRAKENVE